jgi:DNA polymerase III subunit gamma/tau
MLGSVSYQVFARKYRPQVFDDVLGQEHVVRTLKNAVLQRRLAHAYLFVGPRGIGKTSTARILAKSLNCIHAPTLTPCGVCDSCREIAQGISLDVLEIDGASNNSVDQIRELRENVRYAAVRGHYKIYIIDEVHMLTPQAFNALLKTLEEPPEHVIFIFATTEPSRVPSTILSRCQRFDLRRIPAQTIARHLKHIAEQEKIVLTSDAADAVAVAADGGLRDAESMLDQLIAFCGNTIDEAQVLEVFGLTSEVVVTDLAKAIFTGESSVALSIIHQQAESGKDLMRLLSDLLGFLRNILIFKVDAGSLREEVTELMQTALKENRDRISIDHLFRIIEQLSAAEPALRWASNKKLTLEIAVIRAIQWMREVGFNQVLEALEQLRDGSPGTSSKAVETAKAKAPVAQAQPALKSPEADLQPVGGTVSLDAIWAEVRAQVQKRRPLIASWIDHATPLALDQQSLVLGFPSESAIALESLSRAANRKFLNDLVSELVGTEREVRFEVRSNLRPRQTSVALEENAPENFSNDPLIQKALEIFEAEIEAPGERSNP